MKYGYILIPAMALALSACNRTNDYTPAADTDGAAIFQGACTECHSLEKGVIFELSAEKANVAALSEQVSKGGFIMPAFPNIQGEALTKLAEYVLANSKSK